MRNFQITKSKIIINENVNRNEPVLSEQLKVYGEVIIKTLSSYNTSIGMFLNISILNTNSFNPLVVMVLSFEKIKKDFYQIQEPLENILKDAYNNFLKDAISHQDLNLILNYNRGNDVYIICRNQQRFWTVEIAEINASKILMGLLSESN